MSITDELRKWVRDGKGSLLAIADRIDAEHERLMQEQPFTIDMVPITDENMAEHGWVRLPVDADGEYIHIGDEMCGYGWPNGGVYCRAIVNEVTILVGPQDGAYRGWLMWATNECRHHHAPTVEDVLREFALKAAGRECMTMRSDLVDEYAAKLRLREDA